MLVAHRSGITQAAHVLDPAKHVCMVESEGSTPRLRPPYSEFPVQDLALSCLAQRHAVKPKIPLVEYEGR